MNLCNVTVSWWLYDKTTKVKKVLRFVKMHHTNDNL